MMTLLISLRMRSWWKVTIIMNGLLGAKTSPRSGNAHCKKINVLMSLMIQLCGETLSFTHAINMRQENVRRASSSAALASSSLWENLKVRSTKLSKLSSWMSLWPNSICIRSSRCQLLFKKCWLSTMIMRMLKSFYSKVWVEYPSQAMDTGRNSWDWMTISSISSEGFLQPINSLTTLKRPQILSLPWSAPISRTATSTIRSRCQSNSECTLHVPFTRSQTRSS